ncbi:MAG: (Fe-S)-binding protein [Firmicutes bacterium]|nr:(Fe-S)-binding protein [Bacillota bacterium]
MERIKINDHILNHIYKETKNCIECNKCMKNCPMLNEFCKTPKELFKEIINKKEIDLNIPYSCSQCGYCIKVCNENVDLKETFMDLRKYIVKENKGVPKSLNAGSILFHQRSSFSKMFTSFIYPKKDEGIKRVFFPGCSIMAYSPEIVKSTYKYLYEKLPGMGYLQKCCGHPTYLTGDLEKFNIYFSNLKNDIDKMKADEIIVACSNCYNTLKKNTNNIKIKSLWEVISEVGVPDNIKDIGKNIDTVFSIHDPCPTRNEIKIHESVRKIIRELGISIEELKYSKKQTLCCGSGGMIKVTNNKLALNQMKKRAAQGKSEHIISYCQECVESMRQGGKKSVHILDLLFKFPFYKELEFDQVENSLIKKWINRYRGKKITKSKKL